MAELTINGPAGRECADCGATIPAYTECIRDGDEAVCADAPAATRFMAAAS